MPKPMTLDPLTRAREAVTWPTIRETAEEWGVPERWVRETVQRGQVEAFRLDLIRVNPESWRAFLRTRHIAARRI